jgi:hypothetical protein
MLLTCNVLYIDKHHDTESHQYTGASILFRTSTE